MANSPQARKRARQAVVRRARNAGQRSAMRTAVKKVVSALADKDVEKSRTLYHEAVSILDRSARKGLIHRNKAARYKKRLNGHILALQPPAAAPKKQPEPEAEPAQE